MDVALEVLSYIFWVMVAIMILVFVHEMGHYLFAKLFKMRVERFSIGFPPKIIGKKIGETEYVIGATPLGGYVKISGMVDESMDTDFVESEPQEWEFRAKPVWQRIVVITAGVIFNFILAWIIFSGLKLAHGESYVPAENIQAVYVEEGSIAHSMGLRTGDRVVAVSGHRIERFGEIEDASALIADPMSITVERDGRELTFEGPSDIMTQLQRANYSLGISALPSLIGAVMDDSPAQAAGLQKGDRIVSINGDTVQYWAEMTHRLQVDEGEEVAFRFSRPDSLLTGDEPAPVGRVGNASIYQASVRPTFDEELDRYLLGVQAPLDDLLAKEWGARHESYSLGTAIGAGWSQTWINTRLIVTSLKRMITGRENVREGLGGPLTVAKVTKEAADAGASTFWHIVAMLSITLAIMNILPIPALDGGHLMFLLYEGITRRKPSVRVLMVMQQVGMFLILVLMTFLIFNDILKF